MLVKGVMKNIVSFLLNHRGRGTAAEENREYLERFTGAVAVDEVHLSDALSHLSKCKWAESFTQPISFCVFIISKARGSWARLARN